MEARSQDNLSVAIYARVSTEEQKQGQTIDSQVGELERFAREKGWRTAEVYKDEGWSGSLLARPSLDRLRDDARKGLFNGVLINDVDRLARDVTHLGVIKRDLERHGQQVVFRKLPNESSPTNNLMVNILGSFAEFEREMIADRTRRGRRHKVEVRKEFMGCIPPYGFSYIKKSAVSGMAGTLETSPEEASVVRQMYEWVDEEALSARRVLDRLNSLGYLPRKGNPSWAKSSVLRILRSEVYAGTWYYAKHESCLPRSPAKIIKYKRTAKSSRRLRARTDWLPVELPKSLQIVGRGQWARVQRQLDRNLAFSPRNEKHQYLLKGLVRCGVCRARLVGQPCHGKFYYRCMARCRQTPSIQEHVLNDEILRAVENALQNPAFVTEQLAKLKRIEVNGPNKVQADPTRITESLREVQKEEVRIIEAYRMGVLSTTQLAQELEKLRAQKVKIQAEKVRVSEMKSTLFTDAMKRSVEDYCRLVTPRLKALTLGVRQHSLRAIIQEIAFDGRSARIKGALPVPSQGGGTPCRATPADRVQVSSGHIATTTPYPPELNDPLFPGLFGVPVDELGRNVPGDDLDEFDSFFRPPPEMVPFELVCKIPLLPRSRPFIPGPPKNSGDNGGVQKQSF